MEEEKIFNWAFGIGRGTSFYVVANDWRTVPCDSMLMTDDLPLVILWGERIRIGRSKIKGLALCDGQSFKCYFEC
ncbi:hypothetical protein CD148_06225 [Staphylococcus delphini]|uniref:Uncharacterized protein n=1 Tax=Staphylococcus delphini TaxID=53344 RepID=A0AAX0QSE7_9STAP|nr:hypothetical protein B5C07_11135 [Staphylococcus delphini]PNZ95019.1 hypothetical protein CD148_06225 [Staphylococcus delphini]RIZ51497.1 hypothetical protein CDL68_10025 [Staphylococcus delphini]